MLRDRCELREVDGGDERDEEKWVGGREQGARPVIGGDGLVLVWMSLE